LADSEQLRQVVLNLLNNAREAMPDGGKLVLSTGSVQSNGQNFVEFRVKDTGEGVVPEDLDRLFDPFFTTKQEGEGAGLGLYLCQSIIEAHGGTIKAESEKGSGTTVAFQLPLGHDKENAK
jgi:signal transduction histidine kinase